MALPRNCKGCLRVDRITKRCYAFKTPYIEGCPSKCENPSQIIKENNQILARNLNNYVIATECQRIIKDMKKLIYQGLQAAYAEDMNRGSGGGGSKNNKNSGAALKQKMKDNRPIDCKPTRGEINQYSEELKEWQEENDEKLDIHKSIGYGMSRSKVDSYTGLNLGELNDDDIIEAAEKLLKEGRISKESYDDIIYGRVEI